MIPSFPTVHPTPRGRVDYELPFYRYWVKTKFGVAEIKVNKIFMDLYISNSSHQFDGERLAVGLVAWGGVRERLRTIDGILDFPHRYCEMRDKFIAAIEFGRRF